MIYLLDPSSPADTLAVAGKWASECQMTRSPHHAAAPQILFNVQ